MASKSELKRIEVQTGVTIGSEHTWPQIGGYGVIRVMAIADGYCMVRRLGCMPFVVPLRDLASKPPPREGSGS